MNKGFSDSFVEMKRHGGVTVEQVLRPIYQERASFPETLGVILVEKRGSGNGYIRFNPPYYYRRRRDPYLYEALYGRK